MGDSSVDFPVHSEDTSNVAFKKSSVSQNLAANEQSGGIVLAATKSGSLLNSSFPARRCHSFRWRVGYAFTTALSHRRRRVGCQEYVRWFINSMMTLEEFAGKIRESCEIVVFTGAGISTESGIPDFRSPGGIWTRYRPVTYQEFVAGEAARIEAWKRRLETHEAHKNAKPNIGHYLVQSLDAKGKL